MNHSFRLLAALPLIVLAACGQEPAQTESADDFAARVGGETPAPPPGGTPTPASTSTPLPGAAPGQFIPGTATDPKAAGCGATRVAEFYGRQADDATRAAVMNAVAPQTNVRFVQPGSTISPNAASRRLNVMLDATGVIRDARCG